MKKTRAFIKFVMFFAATISVYSAWYIGDFFIPNKQFWRQVIFHKWAQAFAFVANMKIEVIGTMPKPPFFLVSNHLSYVDIPAYRAVLPAVFVAKSDIESWFLAGRMVRDMGAIFIDRRNRRDIPRAGKTVVERIESGEGVIIFPEGTSTSGEEVLPFNSSFLEFAAKNNLPVSYASISYRTEDKTGKASRYVCWGEDISFIDHMLRMFELKEFTAVLTFGEEPITKTDRKELAHELREKVKEKFVPVI